MDKLTPTRLRTDKLSPSAAAHVACAQDRGASPREQIDAARAITGRAMTYLAHQSTREMERRRKRLAK